MNRLKLLAVALVATAAIPAHAIGNLADLKVHDRTAGRELPIFWHEGRAYVAGRPGNEYRITVRNRAGEDLLAVLSVDGVNVVSGQTADTSQGGYVVRERGSLAVKGWRKSLDHTAAFYFTDLGDSYAARTGRPENVGVIGVALFKSRWDPPSLGYDQFDRYGELKRKDGAAKPGTAQSSPAPRSKSAPLGTGHGRNESSYATHAEFERASEHPEEVITIHYDSYRNLVARGIVPTRYGSREPNPFPSQFVPDPVGHYRAWR